VNCENIQLYDETILLRHTFGTGWAARYKFLEDNSPPLYL